MLIIAIPVLLYVPFVQDYAVRAATSQIEKSTGMKVGIERLRLAFPLKLDINGATVIQANGDTMLTSSRLAINVKFLPLLKGQIEIGGAQLDKAFYQLGNNDSTLWLRAHIDRADIDGTDIDPNSGNINLTSADISGVRVRLRMLEDSVETPVDTAESMPWDVRAGRISVRDLTYSMEMLPVFDSLGCHVDLMELCDGHVDMKNKTIYGRSLKADSITASYIYPVVDTKNVAMADSAPQIQDQQWTITADTLHLSARKVLYAQKGVLPRAGFDPAYIEVGNVDIEVDSFYNKGMDIIVPLKRFGADERCGLRFFADGKFSMDKEKMVAESFAIETLKSSLRVNAMMGVGSGDSSHALPLMLKASGRISPDEIAMAFPDMRAMLKPMKPLSISADIEGSSELLNVYRLDLNMTEVAHVTMQGNLSNPFDFERIGGELSIDGNVATLSDKKFRFLPVKTLPALAISGNVDYNPGKVDGDFEISTRGGHLAGAGHWTAKAESYDASIRLSDFPIDAFMPEYGIGRITASASVDGHGYNPMKNSTSIDAAINVESIEYNKAVYRDIALNAILHDGNAKGVFESFNYNADATADFDADLHADTVRWNISTEIRNLNLFALGLTDTINRGSVDITSEGIFNVASSAINARLVASNMSWNFADADIVSPSPIDISLISSDSLLNAALVNGDMNIKLTSGSSLFSFVDKLGSGFTEVLKQTDSMKINVSNLHEAFPRFNMVLDMGPANVASKYLSRMSEIDFKRLTAGIHNDSLIAMSARVNGFAMGNTKLDSISFNAIQHGQYFVYHAMVNNRPGTFDDFAHVTLNGFVGSNRMAAFFKQQNIKGEKGFNFGLSATLKDSIVTVRLVPEKPTIAYKPWTVNKDNFISLDLVNKHLDANLTLRGDDSSVNLFTEHNPDSTAHHHDINERQEDLVLRISQIHLQDWLSINPFAPPVKGDLNADLRFAYNRGVLTGKGNIGLQDLMYGRERVGTFDLDVDVANSPGGRLMADVSLMVDSVKTITARGVLNDSTALSPFLLDFRMIKFPLRVVNPFIPQGMAKLSGLLNGEMQITGDMAKPVFNGYIDFDTTAVMVKMLGTSFKFSENKIPVDSGIVKLDNFEIFGCNRNPITVNGMVNARNIANLGLDLSFAANNIQIVDNSRPHGADFYGKAFLDMSASARGNMNFMKVDADLRILAGTNVTYVMTETSQALASQNTDDMVHFVQFNDTTNTADADSIVSSGMALALNARLHIDQGSVINVDLSANGSDKIHLQPVGDVVYSMSELNGDRMTGRININSGFVRYTPPLMSEKNFEFQEGSFVAFNGNVMNPTLNIRAVDVMKANVTQSGQNSRLVNFDVILSLTNTLENLNVAFDLATDDDITVQNELASMSAEQRANQAMNLLLYNVYTGSGTKGKANLSGNQLYSFLTSKLNTWAANNISGVDISFGIDQYDKTDGGSTSTTTSYSYRVSKTFFNDRFKIVVGGNYSTDADADENFSQNLINDISFEYMLNKSGSMYIKVFRHTGYESILEGEITQTGVGFVLKKKLNSLRELFGVRRD